MSEKSRPLLKLIANPDPDLRVAVGIMGDPPNVQLQRISCWAVLQNTDQLLPINEILPAFILPDTQRMLVCDGQSTIFLGYGYDGDKLAERAKARFEQLLAGKKI